MEIHRESTVCTFCLSLIDDKSVYVVGGIMTDIFQALLLKLDSNVKKKVVICQDCVKDARQCLEFKSSIINAQINVCAADIVKYDVEHLYEKFSNNYHNPDEQHWNTCSFCLVLISKDTAVALDKAVEITILKGLFPEVNINMTKTTQTCIDCWNKLEIYFKFVTSFLDKRISLQNRDRNMSVHGEEIQMYHSDDTPKKHAVVQQKSAEITMYNCEKCSYKTKTKRNLAQHMFIHEDVPETAMYECDKCTYKTKGKHNFMLHITIHQEVTDGDMYKCDICSAKFKFIRYLENHMLIHRTRTETVIYNCDKCSYKTKVKSGLNGHMIVHQDLPVAMYKCHKCSVTTKRKVVLQKHIRTHEHMARILQKATLKCNKCSYEATRKFGFKRHMKLHQEIEKRYVGFF